MEKIPTTYPISSLRHVQDQILAAADESPVLLTSHGKARVVLVNVEQWNQFIDEYEAIRHALSDEIRKTIKQNDGNYVDADDYLDQIEQIHGISELEPAALG